MTPRSDATPVRFDRFELDEANASLLRDGKAVALAPTPFAVLCALVRQPGLLLTKQVLLDQVWGHQFVSESVLKTVISELRTILGDDARNPRFIETVSRRGYRFIAPTVASAPPKSASLVRMRSSPTSSIIGRAEALLRLHGAWDRACGGERSIAWVAGDPGIGKTTLIEHFVGGLGQVTCVHGQCVEQYGGGEPYLPILEALGELCRRDPAVAALLRAVAPTWLLQLPWLSTPDERDALRRELAGISADRTLREMGELLARYTEHQPLLLVTEDLHWSDRATVQLIDYLARRRGSTHFMWLASFRLAEVVALDHPLNPLRREMRLHGLCEEIVLDPFSEEEVAAYVARSSTASAADEAFVRALHERTDGLPLFVASVMNEISAHGGQAGDGVVARAQMARMAVPDRLAAIIEHYIAKLDGDQRTVLSAAAVCGVQFRVYTIAAALEREPAWVGEKCDAMARAGLWLGATRAEGGNDPAKLAYSFRHSLFRQVLYERTAPVTLSQLHRKVASALEREHTAGAPVATTELATHFERAGDATAAARYYAQAAEAAMTRFSPEECMRLTAHASHLLEQVPDDRERNALEISLGTLGGLAAIRVVGAGDEAKSTLQRAYSLLDRVPLHPMRGRLLHGFGFMLCLRAEYAEALAVAERAEALGSTTNDPALLATAYTVRGEVEQLQGRWRSSRAWLERGLDLAQRLDVRSGEFLVDPQVALLGWLSVTLLHLGLLEESRACLERALARARDRRWPMAQLAALWHGALLEVRLGNTDGVAALADQMQALVDEFDLAHGRAACRWFRAWADARMGNTRDAYRRIREAYEDNARLGMLTGSSETLGYAAEALLLAGDVDGAQRQLDEALQLAGRIGEGVYLVQLYLLEAAIARARSDSAGGAAAARRALAEARRQDSPWLELLVVAAA